MISFPGRRLNPAALVAALLCLGLVSLGSAEDLITESLSPVAEPTAMGRFSPQEADRLEKAGVMAIVCEDYDGLNMSFPSRVFVDRNNGEVYVVDGGNSRVLVFTHDLYPLLIIGTSDGLESPVGVAVDNDGFVYVLQAPGKGGVESRISVFNPALSWERDLLFQGFQGAESFKPRNILVTPQGELYVTGDGFTGLVVLDAEGTFIRQLSVEDSVGGEAPRRAMIIDMELDSAGCLYLLSEEMGRVYVFDAQGVPLRSFGSKGGGPGKLSRPRGIALDEDSRRVLLVDYMRHTVNVYSWDGEHLFDFGGKGWREGWFQFPNDIGVDSTGNVLVVDTFNNRVQVMHLE
ncbi:MAG: NHL repeat-containing protein [Proteobacteria bacterium]|nr:NHL repeat-containing protein [Pseudomonadota bacterium]